MVFNHIYRKILNLIELDRIPSLIICILCLIAIIFHDCRIIC